MQRTPNMLVLAIVATMVALATVPTSAAHASTTSDDGKIKVTWGWTDEPATTDAKNGLDLVLRYADNNTGVMGAHEADLHVELRFGDEILTFEAIQPQHGREEEGRYTGLHPVTPSQSGLYVLHLSGTLEGSAIDVTIPATHEVQAIEETYFPPASGRGSGGDTSVLEQRIAALEAKVAALEAEAQAQSEQTPTPTTQTGEGDGASNGIPGAGFVGLLLAAVAAVALASAVRRRGE